MILEDGSAAIVSEFSGVVRVHLTAAPPAATGYLVNLRPAEARTLGQQLLEHASLAEADQARKRNFPP